MPKIVKSSSTEEHKLEKLHISDESSHTFIKSHEDSENSKSKTSSKVSFWRSPGFIYMEAFNFLRSHAIRNDQQNKEKGAR